MRIAVDAVGGDHYPVHPVQGAIMALEQDPRLQILLVGPSDLIHKELSGHQIDESRLQIVDAPQIVGMNESPARAVKTKPNSSISIGLGMQKGRECDAFVSAGNTGALLAASMFILGKLEGVNRPTIATYYPTINGFRLLVDAGANLEVRPEAYYQFGVMGEVYARAVMGISEPRVGLLNVGEEPEKGTGLLREAFQLLSRRERFVGNMEGRDIMLCRADVFVCDGLVGNILLKMAESLAETIKIMLSRSVRLNELSDQEQNVLRGVIDHATEDLDPDNVGGVPFLGVNGISLVGHGSSSPRAIMNLILNASQCVAHKLNDKIVASLKS